MTPASTPASPDAAVATEPAPRTLRQILPLIGAVVITLIAGGLGLYYRNELLGLGRYGLIGVFLINLINNATVILPAPFGLIAVCLFANAAHPLVVGLVGGLGSGLGEYTSYMAGSGGNAVIPKGRVYGIMHAAMLRYGMLFIFVLAAVPNPLFDIGGLIAGALKMAPGKFLAATIAGKVVRLTLFAYGCSQGLPMFRHLLHP
jgi:membrane protein YqaA with SNARE-associated domain